MIKLKPHGNKVLVEPLHFHGNLGSIIVPEAHQDKGSSEAIVVALGTGRTKKNGQRTEFEVKIGDRIVLNRFTGTEIEIGRKRFKMLDPSEILATIE